MFATYFVYRCILEFIFLFVVKDKAVVFDEADDRCLPTWALKEGDKSIEDPILVSTKFEKERSSLHVPLRRVNWLAYLKINKINGYQLYLY